jgi:hypothetical protein
MCKGIPQYVRRGTNENRNANDYPVGFKELCPWELLKDDHLLFYKYREIIKKRIFYYEMIDET